MRSLSAAALSAVALFPVEPARAFELVPLNVTPVSIEASALFISSGPATEQTSGEMPNTASVTLAFSENDHSGTITSSGAILGNAIDFASSIHIDEVGPIFFSSTNVIAKVQIEVPYVGGAKTPIIGVLEDASVSTSGDIDFELGSASPSFPVTSSSLPGSYSPSAVEALDVSIGEGFGQNSKAFLFSALAGDTATVMLSLSARMWPGGAGNPKADRSFTLRLYTVGQAPGNGDMNADGMTDILDSTLLRRLLAGLPIN